MDIRNDNWTAYGLTNHFGQYHRRDIEVAINNVKVTMVDSVEKEEHLKRREDS